MSAAGSMAPGLLLCSLGVALGAGCLRNPTEIVVVADTDLRPGLDFDVIEFSRPNAFDPINAFPVGQGMAVPSTMGFLPQDNGPTQFDVMVDLKRFANNTSLIRRRVSNIRFVSGETRAVLVELVGACQCQGTNCPSAKECRDVTEPTLLPFDENHLPRIAPPAP